MFDPDLAQRIEKGFGIHTAFSASALAAPVFAAAAMRLDVKHSFYVGDTLLNVSEVMVAVGSKLIGLNIAQTEQKYDLSIVFYQNKQLCDVHPLAWQELAAGDTILVLASVPALEKINGDNNSL